MSRIDLSKTRKRTGRPVDEEKRVAIVNAAARAFFDHGYAASSIEAIAAEAGVSKVTIYNQFGGKRELFTAAVVAECGKMRRSFEVPEFVEGTLRERLTEIGEAMTAFLSRPEMIQFDRRISAETEREPGIGKAFLAAGPYRMKMAFAEFLEAMHDAGEVAIDDIPLATEQFVSMCKGMGDLERRFGAEPTRAEDRRRIDGAVEVFCRAYAVDRNCR
ncbi:MAG: transcriptional regulator [Sphingomonadales bacterium CG12_big_fil_rev_8_21_14_0_65_65_10]|jgi:TetR/AcrR family transcriptional regulator, mexJK operon transcriptional repressor|nr:MAG: transcriptional regulator [Sphingomonadales bacterium CG12_big_fil_rev_8_21_14_0_65_65_10]